MLRRGLQFVQDNPRDVARIDSLLRLIGEPHVFSRQQGLMLAAVASDLQPQVILELGTAHGNSTTALAIGAPEATLYTFDLENHWAAEYREALAASGPHAATRSISGDLTRVDFGPLVKEAERVMVFWDCHGFDIAEHMLGHVMPQIADKRHIVMLHDITDNRAHKEWRSYKGCRMWRGQETYYREAGTRAYLNIGHYEAHVDQLLPVLDFCARNDMVLHTVDEDIFIAGKHEEWRAAINGDGLESAICHMAWYSMNETELRYFPAYEIAPAAEPAPAPATAAVEPPREAERQRSALWRLVRGKTG